MAKTTKSPRAAAISAGPSLTKRRLLGAAGALAATAGLPLSARAAEQDHYDVIVVGGGNSGLPTAIFAAQRGARVLIVEAGGEIGGTLFLSSGQMSAAGTKLQKSKGIEDSPQIHYDDIMRISHGTADPTLVKLAVNNAAAVFDWLMDNGLTVGANHPETGTTHEPYSRKRYAWDPKNGGRGILKILKEQIQPHIDSGKIKVMLSTEVTELIRGKDGEIVGVVTKDAKDATARQMGHSVVLTCGGYMFNPEMFAKMESAKEYSQATYPQNVGAGIKLGTSVGGYVRGGQYHTPLFGAVLVDYNYPSPLRALARHFPGDRPPWEIFVNVAGKRFIQEDVLSHTVYEQGLRKQPDERCWAVFDSEIYKKAPTLVTGGFGGPWTPANTEEAFNNGTTPMFFKANTVAELAAKAKVDPKGLQQTVADYNKAQASGKDAFGRKHMPLPIAKAPFYAVQLQSWGLTSYAGLAVDGQLRVITHEGKPIGNLYAAGELLGMGQMMGECVCGGMSVTPALALGRLLGHEILKFEV